MDEIGGAAKWHENIYEGREECANRPRLQTQTMAVKNDDEAFKWLYHFVSTH